MAKRKTTQFMAVNHDIQTTDINIFMKDVNNLIAYLRRKAKREKWRYNIIVAISEHDRFIHKKVKIINGVGRPSVAFKQTVNINNSNIGQYIVKPHGHILIKANPGRAVVGDLKEYWEERHGKNTFSFRMTNEESGTGTYSSFKEYAIPQATGIRKDSYGYVGNFI